MHDLLHFEDFAPGDVHELGERTLSTDEIVAFGRRWDPLEFHVDPGAGGPYGGLIASGRQSCLVWTRLCADALLRRAAALGSPGIDEITWHVPVRPGDTLRARLRVAAATPSPDGADRGTVEFVGELLNQDDAVTTTIRARYAFARRAA
jgi:acyl dehydratase